MVGKLFCKNCGASLDPTDLLAGGTLVLTRKFGDSLAYIYAGLFLVSDLLGLWFITQGIGDMIGHGSPGTSRIVAFQFWGLAAILISGGIVRFLRVLRKYPSLAEESVMEAGVDVHQ